MFGGGVWKKKLSFSCGVHSVGSQRMFNDF
jgi:hypothetical protein